MRDLSLDSSRLSVVVLHKGDDLQFPKPNARVNQIHGKRTIRVFGPQDATEQADGMVTDVPGLSLIIRVADCQNICFYDPKHHALGAVHAGWRGLLAGAIEECVATLQKEFQTDLKTLVVIAGPSLCKKCAEFTAPKKELPGIDEKFFQGRLVDLPGIADEKLLKLGILKNNIHRDPDCTKCSKEKYWSYRAEREKVTDGHHNFLVCSLRELGKNT